jgi:hypothetical protein
LRRVSLVLACWAVLTAIGVIVAAATNRVVATLGVPAVVVSPTDAIADAVVVDVAAILAGCIAHVARMAFHHTGTIVRLEPPCCAHCAGKRVVQGPCSFLSG